MEQTECSKTLAYKIQMSGNYPEESIQYEAFCLKYTILVPHREEIAWGQRKLHIEKLHSSLYIASVVN